MAIYKQNIVNIDLDKANVFRSKLNHSIGLNDNIADHFGVRVFRSGVAVDLTGVSVVGYFRKPDNTIVTIRSGNLVSDNEAAVVLPSSCYTVAGQFCLYIKLADSNITSTVRIVDGTVEPNS